MSAWLRLWSHPATGCQRVAFAARSHGQDSGAAAACATVYPPIMLMRAPAAQRSAFLAGRSPAFFPTNNHNTQTLTYP